MIPSRPKRLSFPFIRAMLLAFVAVVITWGGFLTPLEHLLYNARVVHCQWFMPPPTRELVHLDIDDTALAQVGHWPWSGPVLAEIVDEVRLTQPKVLATDILFSEPYPARYDSKGNKLDDDAIFAGAIERFGRALVPVSVSFDPVVSGGVLPKRLMQLLIDDPERTPEECAVLLGDQGLTLSSIDPQIWLSVWPQAVDERIRRELPVISTPPDVDTESEIAARIKQKLIPHLNPLSRSPLERLFDEEYPIVVREAAMQRFTLPLQAGLPPVLTATRQITPILPLAQATAFSGFVDYFPDSIDGTVHSVPLFVNYRDRLVPHFGLVTACAILGVDIHDVKIGQESVTIPCPNGKSIVIPVSVRKSTTHGDVGMLMEVPMFGRKNQWETMYDYPNHEKIVQHVSVAAVWQACLTRRRIAANESSADKVLVAFLKLTDEKAAADYAAAPLQGAAKNALIASTLDVLGQLISGLAASDNPDDATRQLLDNYRTYNAQLRDILLQGDLLNRQLEQLRADLKAQLGNRAVLLGGTGTGQPDTHPTSLFFSCPGIVIQGAIVNAIITGKMWRIASDNLTVLMTAIMGILTIAAVSLLAPLRAFIVSFGLAIGYLAIDGYVLFDYHGLILGAAGPTFAVGLVWSGTTLTNFIAAVAERKREVAERKRITRRFSNYVDPELVKWVQDHPEQEHFDGESREMTIGFTDIAGFLALMDKLEEKAIPILKGYMTAMVPVIRAHKGYVAKLMGDGIFFFFGAPKPDTHHARHAVAALLGMRTALDEYNKKLVKDGKKALNMRAGLSTGQVIIGDAGAADFSDYTALGSPTNLASRLELANKNFGTYALVTHRTIELLEGAYLVRPIANLVVAGRTAPVVVYEPICLIGQATQEQRQLVLQTEGMVSAYREGDFGGCIEAAKLMEQSFGPSTLTNFYCSLCQEYLRNPPTDFNGRVVLTEK